MSATERTYAAAGMPPDRYEDPLMYTRFNVFETLQIAERIEHKDAEYYLSMAQKAADAELRTICLKLANWKVKHEKVLEKRRKDYSEKTGEFGTFDPDDYVLSNPQAMAGLASLADKQRVARNAARWTSTADLYREAVKRERETAVFYEGLKHFVADPACEEAITEILMEKNRHIARLSESAIA